MSSNKTKSIIHEQTFCITARKKFDNQHQRRSKHSAPERKRIAQQDGRDVPTEQDHLNKLVYEIYVDIKKNRLKFRNKRKREKMAYVVRGEYDMVYQLDRV